MRNDASQTTTTGGVQLAPTRLSGYNVLAVFPDLDGARKAMEELGRAGISGDDISLLGPAAEEAVSHENTRESDARMMTHWTAGVIRWGATGAVIGFAGGIPVGIAGMAAIGVDITLVNVIVAALLGALFISTITALIGSMYYIQDADQWELSFQQTYAGKAVLGVHSQDQNTLDTARRVLDRLHPIALESRTPGENTGRAANELARGARS